MTTDDEPIHAALVKLQDALQLATEAYEEWHGAVEKHGTPAHRYAFEWRRMEIDGRRQEQVIIAYSEPEAWAAFGHLIKTFKHVPRDIRVIDEGVDNYTPKRIG